jgi:murein DD-endopeptidase MepM/ murein hydrolase activator NlpD
MQRIARQDLDLLDQIKDETERIARYRATVQRQKEQVSVLQAQAAEKHEAVARETAACARWVSQLAQERAAYERALAELERNSREIEAMIQRLQRSPAGRTRFMRPWRGSFMRPVAGPIVSGFGYRIHPIYKVRAFHNGLDIAAPTGTPIHAAGAGYVIHSGWWGGYGNCVIIDHGGGVSTVYGHCSSLVAQAGQKVRRGQVIAAVGSTGLSTGPHLHFEVRHSGKPVPPQ